MVVWEEPYYVEQKYAVCTRREVHVGDITQSLASGYGTSCSKEH